MDSVEFEIRRGVWNSRGGWKKKKLIVREGRVGIVGWRAGDEKN